MKRVTIEVAEAIKDFGYPQYDYISGGYSLEEINSEKVECYFYRGYIYDMSLMRQGGVRYAAAPFYMEFLLWLCKEKGFTTSLHYDKDFGLWNFWLSGLDEPIQSTDIEDAVVKAIDQLACNGFKR